MYANVMCKIMQVLDERSGTSKSSGKPWHSVTYLAEVGGMRPYSFTFSRMMQEGEAMLEVGKVVNIDCVVEASMYQNKWYNNVRCVKIE